MIVGGSQEDHLRGRHGGLEGFVVVHDGGGKGVEVKGRDERETEERY
jgi:hypothetical protein